MKALAALVLIACTRAAPPVVLSGAAPRTPITWLDRCEDRLRHAAQGLMSAGLPGPILTQRERPTNWGAAAYDPLIEAAETNPAVFPDPDPTRATSTATDGLIFAIGRSMKFRVLLVPIACQPKASHEEPWFDDRAPEPAEIMMRARGVSAVIHSDAALLAQPFATRFVELMQPIVEACIADRPAIVVTEICPDDPW